jgi:uncharacterized protein YeaO (DUF488 family)
MQIHIKRIYETPSGHDGTRVLVDRIWPRGVKKEEARLDLWLKEVAPSTQLRKWFNHEPDKWEAFKDRYWRELCNNPEAFNKLKTQCYRGDVTLLFSVRSYEFNQAAALREFLQHNPASEDDMNEPASPACYQGDFGEF